jgi:hypothetical protein
MPAFRRMPIPLGIYSPNLGSFGFWNSLDKPSFWAGTYAAHDFRFLKQLPAPPRFSFLRYSLRMNRRSRECRRARSCLMRTLGPLAFGQERAKLPKSLGRNRVLFIT